MNGRPSKSHPVFSPERIAFVKEHLATAKQFPNKVAEMMRAVGLYSAKTYLGDIERTVKKIVDNISMGEKSKTVYRAPTLEPPMCLHKSIRYDAEKDNFYCNDCYGGMGLAYYRVAKELMRVQAEGRDFQGKGLPNIQRLRKGRKSLCVVVEGVGLCDDCGKPKRPQKPDGYGSMICADCDEKHGVISAFKNWLLMFDERNRDVILEWMDTPEAFPTIVKILVEGPKL
jgi:hypothetical protein